MNKYNLKIIVPVLNKTFEILTPNNILVGNLLYMLINSLNELNNISFDKVLLYSSYTGKELNVSEYVFKILKNGDTLILM